MLQDGDKVVIRSRFSGTHNGGEFMSIPPTGNRFDIAVIDIMEFAGDKMIGHWGVMDNAAMMQQLGVGDPPGLGSHFGAVQTRAATGPSAHPQPAT